MNITYRNYTAEDIDSIIRFWNENSGWEDNMDRAEFNKRFCASPLGLPIMMLAIDEDINEVVGLCCFLPIGVTVNGNDQKCYRTFGAVFKESFRDKFGITSFLTGKHPIVQLYNKGAKEAFEEEAALIYLLPDPRWKKILQIMPFETRQFPLWSYKLTLVEPFILSDGIKIEKIDEIGQDIDVLWQQSLKKNLCTLTKNSLFYKFKVGFRPGHYKLYGVYDNGKLIGLFTIDNKNGGMQWRICDLLTLDNDDTLTLTLKAACNVVHLDVAKRTFKENFYKAAILATPLIEQKVKELGFYKDDYNFVLAVHSLGGKQNHKEVAPERWYISAND